LNDAQADIAVLVDDAWQGDDIGSLLIEHLAAVARRSEIRELVGDVLASNVAMLRASAGLAPGIPVIMVRILKWFVFISQPSLTNERSPRPAYATALPNTIRCASAGPCLPGRDRCQPIEARRWVRDPAAVLGGGFTRPLYPVNPHAKTIDGLDCYPSIGAILEGGGQLLPCLLRESSRSLSPAAGGSEAFGWVWSRLNRGSAAACGRRRTYTNETTK
jgi:hypothetical protein